KFIDAPRPAGAIAAADRQGGLRYTNEMTTPPTPQLLARHFRRGLLASGGEPGDGQLLEAFLARRDEAAFEALVRRHGPMVLGVGRRVLGSAQDAEDVYQATF